MYTTELLAIWWALDWSERNKADVYYIYSDSVSALQAISAGITGARADIVLEILSCLHRIESVGSRVMFCWCPSHSGVVGNEAAEALAKESLGSNEIEYVRSYGKMECISIIKRTGQAQWQMEWEKEKRGRYYFNCQPLLQNRRPLWSSSRANQVENNKIKTGVLWICGLPTGKRQAP